MVFRFRQESESEVRVELVEREINCLSWLEEEAHNMLIFEFELNGQISRVSHSEIRTNYHHSAILREKCFNK